MKRRKLLQALTALPAMVIAGKNGEQIGVKYETNANKHYVVFLNASMVDIEEFCAPRVVIGSEPLPPHTPVYAVYPYGDETMDDIIRIYEVEKD